MTPKDKEEKPDGFVICSDTGVFAAEFPSGLTYVFSDQADADTELREIKKAGEGEGWRIRPVKLIYLDEEGE